MKNTLNISKLNILSEEKDRKSWMVWKKEFVKKKKNLILSNLKFLKISDKYPEKASSIPIWG